MSETLEKLRPDRDLQCYFFRPSAIAALSQSSPTGFHVSGTWRQQFDWAVVEWNRDNVFEHPLMRPLPDGDLSGLTLSYRESRTNCILVDSALFPTVDWPFLRIWAEDANGNEQIYFVPLKNHKTAVAGAYEAASATFDLSGPLTNGDLIELSWLSEHYNYTVQPGDTVDSILTNFAATIEAISLTVSASHPAGSSQIVLTNRSPGEDGNRMGIVAGAQGIPHSVWTPEGQTMSGGASPTEWQFDLDFGALLDVNEVPVPTQKVRKMRWTYAAALQDGEFQRSDFDVTVSGWSVTGANRLYAVSGPGSRRIENDEATLTGAWTRGEGNFFGGSIHETTTIGSTAAVSFQTQSSRELYLGSRRTARGGQIEVRVDGGPAQTFDLRVFGEDYLLRLPLGSIGPGAHNVTAELVARTPPSTNNSFYFDYVELSSPTTTIEPQPVRARETLATDWDTDHSLVLSPERVAWNLDFLGFRGRANHYVGAILFYELTNPTNVFATGTVTFAGTPVFSQQVKIVIDGTEFRRFSLLTDTPESTAQNFAYLINNGSTGVRASVSGSVLTITSRLLGSAGNNLTLTASPSTGQFTAIASGPALTGGFDGKWITDTAALPRTNRAARDWHRSYFVALDALGLECTAAYSTELSHGDPSAAAGIAQRYPDGNAVLLNTPAIQTNFSPTSIDYWKQVYLEMAQLQVEAGTAPWLQFGEVQWWYFPRLNPFVPGMTFYDAYTTSTFEAQYGRPMHVFQNNIDDIAGFDDELAHLAGLIGTYTATIRNFVLATYPQTRFEVLYPHDVNDFPLTRAVNYPDTDWTPSNYENLKTENFTYTGERKMNKALESILFPFEKGFTRATASHLIGVMFASEPWMVERILAEREDVESIVFWAFDQFSMIGYDLPLRNGVRRSRFFG